jgi:hypothetical protein
MPPLPPTTGALAVFVDGSSVEAAAGFGEPEEECTTLAREGACVLEACITPFQELATLPHAGVIDVRTPTKSVHHLVPDALGFYSREASFREPSIPERFTFIAEGNRVPSFSVDVATPGALGAVALPGADPRSANADLEIAHEPFDASFELVMRREIGPRVHCTFTGGSAVVPRQVLGGLDRDRVIRASAMTISHERITVGDYTIDARVIRDRKDFELRLTPTEPSSGP